MKKIFSISILFTIHSFGQIGINTLNPKATLDIQGSMRVSTIKEKAERPKYIVAVDDNQTLRTIARDSFEDDTPTLYSPRLAGAFRLSTSFTCICNKNIIPFNENVIINNEYLQRNSNGRYTILSDGRYQFTIQIGVNLATPGSNLIVGIIDGKSNWIGKATFSSFNRRRLFKVYTTTLNLKKGDTFSIAFSSLHSTVVQGLQTGSSGNGNVTNFSIIKF